MNNELTREEKIKYYEDMIEQYKTLGRNTILLW